MTLAPAGIFKAYDIRGLYGTEMDETTALAIGRGFIRVLSSLRDKPASELRVGLGRDMRLTSPSMAAEVRDGMVIEGATVLDAGMVATEMLYHLVGSHDLDGGAMVTASHNPKAYTGVKLIREGALALSGDAGIGDVHREIEAGLGHGPGGGSFEDVDIWDEYRAHAASFIDGSKVRPMKVVVDGGNGMAGPMVGPILQDLGLDLEEMYFEPDGEFPDHEPNPLLEENRLQIIDRVRSSGADLGIAWDGDADRCFFIDGDGRFCDGDFVCALLARTLLRRNPGAMILYDPRSSRAVPDLVAADGGRSDISRVGHAFFKRKMREDDAVFGGEVSGHYYFRDFWCADSGVIPALLMLELRLGRRPHTRRSDGGLPLALLHLRRDQLRGRRSGREAGGDRRSLRRRRSEPARRHLGRLPRLALQRPPLEHRAPPPSDARVAGLARATWKRAATSCSN